MIISGRRKDLLHKLAAEHEGLETVEVDVADPASIAAAFETVTTAHPDLNVLITMAGSMQMENLLDPAHQQTAEETIDINLLGTIRTVATFTPFLITRPDAATITVSSGLATVPLAITPTYNATKAAVHSYTQSLRLQLADTSVQVIELVPPAVRTTLLGQQDNERAMPLDEYLTETMELIQQRPDADEILVERVKFLRLAEREGRFDQTLAAVNSH